MWIPKQEEKHYFCHSCRNELVFEVKMQRTDTCPHCGTDLHCCMNCEYWDPGYRNQCRENIAEYVSDRARANHCTHLRLKSGERDKSEKDAALSRLESLFGKKG